ncbi:MAG: hypothetical protein AB7R40_11370 [Nitrospiraceae bacterium]
MANKIRVINCGFMTLLTMFLIGSFGARGAGSTRYYKANQQEEYHLSHLQVHYIGSGAGDDGHVFGQGSTVAIRRKTIFIMGQSTTLSNRLTGNG